MTKSHGCNPIPCLEQNLVEHMFVTKSFSRQPLATYLTAEQRLVPLTSWPGIVVLETSQLPVLRKPDWRTRHERLETRNQFNALQLLVARSPTTEMAPVHDQAVHLLG